jgi:hypothetical protein
MACEHCADVNQEISFSTPAQLAHGIRVVQGNIRDGTLVQGDSDALISVIGLSPDGPWPDVFDTFLRCAHCGAEYRFSADTYHGSGGGDHQSRVRVLM